MALSRGFIRYFISFPALVIVGLTLLWGYGFIQFVAIIPEKVPDAKTPTDAAIILTGGSDRLLEGVRLLNQGKAKRAFISGVGQGADLETMLILSGKLPNNIRTLTQHIDLGFAAQDTKGNAEEAADWLYRYGFRSVRLVTANYHIPRSLLEFKATMPDVILIPHPVFPKHVVMERWWENRGTLWLLLSEYHKYLAAFARFHFQRK